jgi:hypothetical protein
LRRKEEGEGGRTRRKKVDGGGEDPLHKVAVDAEAERKTAKKLGTFWKNSGNSKTTAHH